MAYTFPWQTDTSGLCNHLRRKVKFHGRYAADYTIMSDSSIAIFIRRSSVPSMPGTIQAKIPYHCSVAMSDQIATEKILERLEKEGEWFPNFGYEILPFVMDAETVSKQKPVIKYPVFDIFLEPFRLEHVLHVRQHDQEIQIGDLVKIDNKTYQITSFTAVPDAGEPMSYLCEILPTKSYAERQASAIDLSDFMIEE